MAKKKVVRAALAETIRVCANIRSKKHPDVQCSYSAIHGEFCSRHYKNPTRFQLKSSKENIVTIAKTNSAKKLQTWWRYHIGYLRFRNQGPAANLPDVAENQTDIFTLESTNNIPLLYRWSYGDDKKHIWLFDVRSLSMTRAQDSRGLLLNPYTREPFPAQAEKQYQERCAWLRSKKYCLVHTPNDDLTPEQLWHQKILDVTMKYDVLGYHTCLHWFEELTLRQLIQFYLELWELWFYRLQLNTTIKKQVVPNWNRNDSLLFKWNPIDLLHRNEKKWWQKTILDLLDRFISSAETKEYKVLGALYGMTAFALVSEEVREHYPWLVEMPENT